MGALVEERADGLAECVCTVLRCSGAVVVVLASLCTQRKPSEEEEEVEEQVNLSDLD